MKPKRDRTYAPPFARQRAAHEVSGHDQTAISHVTIVTAALCLLFVTPANAKAQTTNRQPDQEIAAIPPNPLNPESIRASADVQRRVRDSARELVGTILDSQLEQLQQNGLQQSDVYGDIKSMRGDIDSLIDANMPDVVELLQRAEQASSKNRGPIYSEARSKIREILTRLLADRRGLARRLRIAELAAQTRLLIEKQTAVRSATESLSDAAQQRQSDAALATVQDQRDIKALLDQLVASLTEVSAWSGEIGAAATDGVRILQSANASSEADTAAGSLELGKFGNASKSQQSVIVALRSLIGRLQLLQGIDRSSAAEALKLVRELEKRQTDLLAQTKQSDLQVASVDPLVDRQTGINKDIAKLSPSLENLPAAQPELEQAKAAADKARSRLFEAKQAEAIDAQSTALGALKEIERQLERAGNSRPADKSAAELAQQLEALQRARQYVAEAQNREQQASATAIEHPPQAASEDVHAADELKKASDAAPLPATVQSRVEEAKAAAAQAAQTAQADAAPAAKSAAQQAASESLDRAAAEVAAAINDTKLDQKAVAVGELARAAEGLERATAAEKEIASETADATKKSGVAAEQAANMVASQVDVKRIAEKIAAGVKQLAPEASAKLDSAASQINAAGRDLMAAKQQPGESSKSALADATKNARAASDELTKAAAELRKAVAKEAGALEQTADEQSKPVAQRRSDVQSFEQTADTADRASKLTKLAKSTAPIDPDAGSALREAAKAAAELNSQNGRPLAQRISDALQQADASLAAREQRLEDAKQLARQIVADAQLQQQAREAIQADAAKLAGAQSQAAAAELEATEEAFAQAQNRIGEDAARVSGQMQITNQPIREGLEAASHLNSQGSAANQHAEDSDQTGGDRAEYMGTGMVPNSPMVTARQIAGPEASAAASAAQSATASRSRSGQSSSNRQSNGQPGESQNHGDRANQLGTAAPASTGGLGIKSGQKTNNVAQINEKLQPPTAAHPNGNNHGPSNSPGRDASPSPHAVSQEPPWFADLPPEARNAIRAKAHRAAPKVYEDRLKDYFENSEIAR